MMAAASTSKTRIPIKLSPHLFARPQDNDTAPSYHALHHDPLGGLLQLGGATLQLSGNNGSNGVSSSSSGMGSAVSVSAADGTKLNGRMKTADEHDYVLLYDEASRSYVLHKLSSVAHLQPSSSSTSSTKATTPKPRSNADNSNNAGAKPSSNSPAIARTPQSTNSPSVASSSKSSAARARQVSSSKYLSPSDGAARSGTAKKSANQNKHSSNGYDSSPTPSTVGKNTPATYGLGISSAAGPSPSIKNAISHSASQKGKAAVQEVEEFDMGTSDEDLLTSTLQLPPSQGSLPLSTIQPDSGSRHRPVAAASTSLSMSSNQDVVMSDSSSEDEGDFADLANDLESSLAGQGPFARAGGAGGGGAGTQHTLISSDDEDDDDSDFVNAFAEQVKPATSRQLVQQPRPSQQQYQQEAPRVPPQQPPRQDPTAPYQAPSQASRPSQAGKKLPTTRTYDSDIASSSESDDSD